VYGAASSTVDDDPPTLPPFEVPGFPPDFDPAPLPDPYPEDPYPGDGDTGGDGGGGSEPIPDALCPLLLANKPEGCGNPVLMPAGATYGEAEFQFGSALQGALSYTRTPTTFPVVAESLLSALATHTSALARLTVPVDNVNRQLIEAVQAACDLQSALISVDFGQFGLRPNPSEVRCAQIVKILIDETGIPFTPWFVSWLDRQSSLAITDFIPQTILNWISPDNSLERKEKKAQRDATCANWWTEVQARRCGQ